MRKNLQHIQLKYSDHWGEVKNLENLEHLDFAAGFPPFLRGINSTMYVYHPFEILQNQVSLLDSQADFDCLFQESGISADTEIAYTLLNGIERIKSGLAEGMKIDDLASQFSFSFELGANHYIDIAKLRAARLVWAKLMQQFYPKDPKSMALHIHCQTSERTLKSHEPYENYTRICVETMTGVFGGIQSLQIKVLNDSVKDSEDFSNRIILNIQTYLQKEAKITKTVDPWGGSFYMESLTHEIVQRAWKQIEELLKLD